MSDISYSKFLKQSTPILLTDKTLATAPHSNA